MKLPFSSVEYRRRLANTKARMEEAGIDVLFASDPANMNYLTGYDGWSFYVHQMVVVAQDEPEPLWIGRPMDANGARVTTWLHHDNIYDYPDHFVQSTEHHPMDLVADIARERRWARKRIGVEMDAYYFTGACIERLRAKLPRVRFKDATGLVNWVRIVKSRRELEYISQAARIAEKVMRTGIDHVRPGLRQCDAAAEIWRNRGARHPRVRRRLPLPSAHAADRRRHFRAPSDLDRREVQEGAGHRARTRRRAPALPLPHGAHRLPGDNRPRKWPIPPRWWSRVWRRRLPP